MANEYLLTVAASGAIVQPLVITETCKVDQKASGGLTLPKILQC